jgi:putative ABC transport system permease protein
VVIDADLARAAFGGAEPIGKRLADPPKKAPKDPADVRREERVVGVIDDFRKEGELLGVHNTVIDYEPVETGWKSRPSYPSFLLVRVAPGTTASFEGDFVRRLQALAPSWSFEPQPLASLRRTYFRNTLIPLTLGAIVAAFLLLMVGLGLIGVLWQSVVRRTRELGLRRAVGASRAAVLRQIVWEQLLLTTLGVLIGTLVAAQLPLLRPFASLDPRVLAGGLSASAAVLYVLSLLCALYPSSLAGRLPPADALRYE